MMSGTCSSHGEIRNAYKILISDNEGQIPFGKGSTHGSIALKLS
jgi:hypothetical protein